MKPAEHALPRSSPSLLGAPGLRPATETQQIPSPSGTSELSGDRLCILGAAIVLFLQLWFGMISTSLWLDETGTWWIVKDGPAEAIKRAWLWSGQSPFYYLLVCLSSQIFGLNEIALRLPSVIAMCGALFFLHRIAERLYEPGTALTITYLFLCAASFFAVDARPYALAFFCLGVSFWALLRWLDTGRTLHAILYAIASASVVYAHSIPALSLGAGVIYAAVTLRQSRRLLHLGLLQIAIAALCAPLILQLRTFYAARAVHNFSGLPPLREFVSAFVPCSPAGALILLAWVGIRSEGETRITARPRSTLLACAWAFLAPSVLALLLVFSDLRLFVYRYYSSALPGQALLAGSILASINRRNIRNALVIAVAVGTILAQGRFSVASHGDDNWRDALAFTRQEAGKVPVLEVSSFIEAVDFHSIADPRFREILFAPEVYYGEPPGAVHLPRTVPMHDSTGLQKLVERLGSESRFYLLNNNDAWASWLQSHSACKLENRRTFGAVWVARFACSNSIPPRQSAANSSNQEPPHKCLRRAVC